MTDEEDLVKRLRDRMTSIETRSTDKLLMAEAADMIEELVMRIETEWMERRYAD